MRIFKTIITFLLMLASLGYLGYSIYLYSRSPCDQVLAYTIGQFDPQFGVSREIFLNRLKVAESVWEKALGRELFVYDQSAQFKINLIYDERQLATVEKQKTESGLSAVEATLKNLDTEFAGAKREYDSRSANYQSVVAVFEARQAKYESNVDYWNKRGGAPKDEYNDLRLEADYLRSEATRLNAEAGALNVLTKELNQLLDRRNQAAAEYNKVAKRYNEKYGHGLEFNQAEYNGKGINVYQFSDQKDLDIALSHEFGHALGMDHVENSASIMYYLTGGNTEVDLTPSVEDIRELNRVCK